MKNWLFLLLAVVILWGGCTPVLSPSPTMTPAPTQRSEPNSTIIEYRRNGGIAGFSDQVLVYADGRVEITRRQEKKSAGLTRSELDGLLALFEKADLASVKTAKLAPKCCDLFEYTIIYKGITVYAIDTAIPERVSPLIAAMNKLLE